MGPNEEVSWLEIAVANGDRLQETVKVWLGDFYFTISLKFDAMVTPSRLFMSL